MGPLNPNTSIIDCANCNLRDLCLPLSKDDFERIDTLVTARRTVKRGDLLLRNGAIFNNLFAIRSGFFKIYLTLASGQEQVIGFQMSGEIIGLDGLESDQHVHNAVALEDAEVCVLPYDRIGELSREVPALQRHVHVLMSRDLVRTQNMMLLLGTQNAEERLAAFLLNLSQRFHERGYSQSELVLRMTREEIGSYLGLKIETVSRAFTKLVASGILDVRHRDIHILNPEALGALVKSQI